MWPVWAQFEVWGQSIRLTGYGAFAVLGAAAGMLVLLGMARRVGFAPFDAFAAGAIGLGTGVLGARLAYIAVHLPQAGWPELPRLAGTGGLVFYGGVLAGGAAALGYLHAFDLDRLRFLDAAAPALALGHAVGRMGCLMAGCCYGRPTELPWGIRFPASETFVGPVGVALHPVPVYEALGEVALACVAARLTVRASPGRGFFVWLAGYGSMRLVLEQFFRGDDRGVSLYGWSVSAAVSALLIAAAGAGWLASRRAPGLTRESDVSLMP